MKLGDLIIDAYFCKIESIATILACLGSPISKDDIVNISHDGLPEKYEHVYDIIIHREPFLDLNTVRDMLITAEIRLKSRAQVTTLDSSSSSPMVLLANSANNNARRSTGTLVSVGDGYSIPVTNYGHRILPTPHRPLHLHNLFITPNIVKNLISALLTANHRDYRCLDLNTNKIIISRHVTFDEMVFAFGSMTPTLSPSYEFLDDSSNIISIIIRSSLVFNINLEPITVDTHTGPSNTFPGPIPTEFDATLEPTPVTNQNNPPVVVTHHYLSQRIITSLHQRFSMTDLGSLNYFVGISVMRDSPGMFLSQRKYTTEILEQAHMVGCNSSRTPVDIESKLGDDGDPVSDPMLYKSLAGSLHYLTFTRLNVSFVIHQVCLYMHDPREPHFLALKIILRYVRGTLDHGLQLFSSSTSSLVAYSDADWAGCPNTRRWTSGGRVSWCANVVAETCWLRNLLRYLHTPLSSATLVYCDNVSAVYLSSNPFQHKRTKHIEIDIHFVQDLVAAGRVQVLHVSSRYQYANIFTKGLPSALFEEFRSNLSVRYPPALTA
nr:ribonuclease H-like domain-containing protein [Tanacetum cinerariifolium]